MYSCKLLKTFLIPAAALVAEEHSKECPRRSCFCRPSELPIYVPDPPPASKEPEAEVPALLEEGVATIRRQVTNVAQEIRAYKRVGYDYLDEGKEKAEWLLKYLRQEDNATPKYGAIAIGGLTGLVLGLRGRFFKRALYTTTGALAMAAVCYPQEASQYSEVALTEAKKYATIAYNFAYGVKKDDPPMELPSLPTLPSSLSGAWDTVIKTATSLVSGKTSTEPIQVTAAAQVDK